MATIPAHSELTIFCPLPAGELLVPFTNAALLTVKVTLTGGGTRPLVFGPETLTVYPPAHLFSDVPLWVADAVDWIAYYEVAEGYPNGTFRPDDPITRAQTTRMAHRLDGEPATDHTHSFNDVPPWVTDAVDWATDPAGPAMPEPLMNGYPDGGFHPDASITRGEVVRLLYRFAGSPRVDGLPDPGFSDVPAWVEDAVRWAAHDPDGSTGPLEPIATGYSDGTFRSGADITRAQVTRMLHRLAATLDL